MVVKRDRAKKRRESGTFIPIPTSVLRHKNYISLNAYAIKLLMDMIEQLRFKEGGSVNNGDITATWSVMQQRGWKSKETLQFAINELMHYGFIKLTRQGGRNWCSLYAVTWWAIDECGGKLDIRETRTPSNEWKEALDKWKRPQRKQALAN